MDRVILIITSPLNFIPELVQFLFNPISDKSRDRTNL